MTRLFATLTMIATFMIPSVSIAGDAEAGKAKFQLLCASCHGAEGKGDGPTGLSLAAAKQPAPRDFSVGDFKFDTDEDGNPGTDIDLRNVITKGALVYGGSAMMAPVRISDTDLDNMIALIRSFKQ